MSCVPTAQATDPPHYAGNSIECTTCHVVHNAPGGDITAGIGNANLCESCHMTGGTAATTQFAETDQAFPLTGLPAGQSPSGTSHRWDSGPSGHVEAVGTITSTGHVESAGNYTGRYPNTYTITITTAGNVGVARFSWVDTLTGTGTNILTGASVALDLGITLAFADGLPAPSFALNNQWRIYVRPDIVAPTNATMAARTTNGKVMCSTCHDEHSQLQEPFDRTAPAYAGAGTGNGRHDQRIANNTNQMCVDCHSPRNVTTATAGSHPVNVSNPVGDYKAPTTLPLDKTTNKIQCMTCHTLHYSPAADGSLARLSNINALCTDCHQNCDVVNGSHFKATTGALWPGGQYGSTYPPITDTTKRGFCANCHAPHGWPDNLTPANDFPKLLVERADLSDTKGDPDSAENLCYTCHDDGPAKGNIMADFAKAVHHPIKDSEQVAGRSVECRDCHNVHKAQSGSHVYTTVATSARNLVSNVLKGVSGLSVNFTGLGNFVSPPPANYTVIPASTGATYEYQICVKCHSGTALPATATDVAQEFNPNNKSGHPIVTGLNNYPNSAAPKPLVAAQLLAPWATNMGTQTMMCSDCHNTDAASTAAQGPHGSAAQFMLRGNNAANWPNVTLSNFATSWCANCHQKGSDRGHASGDHSGTACYRCHIVIPHGGKMSRLIACANGTMPARYAYNNTLSNVYMANFTKAAMGSYSESSSCKTVNSCSHHSNGTATETW